MRRIEEIKRKLCDAHPDAYSLVVIVLSLGFEAAILLATIGLGALILEAI
jgi:hypothetical protein